MYEALMYCCLVFSFIFEVRTSFFRCALLVLGTGTEVRRCANGPSKEKKGAEVRVRTTMRPRCGGAGTDYPKSSTAPSSVFTSNDPVLRHTLH